MLIALYQRGCELGTATGCLNAGIVFERGRRTRTDKALALEIYEHGCKLNDRYSCRSAVRLRGVLLGRPSERYIEPGPMGLFGTTRGKTTIKELQTLHPIYLKNNFGCAGCVTYAISGDALDGSLSGHANFFFNEKGVLAGLTALV